MNARDFVEAVRKVVMDASVSDVISIVERPPGRRPGGDLLELSAWYHQLKEPDRVMLKRTLALVARQAVFGVLAVLDGARKVTPAGSPGDYFELRYVGADTEEILSGPKGAPLHELL